jgi:hypothetical protein
LIFYREKPEEPLIKPSDLIEVKSPAKDIQEYNFNEFLERNVERYANNLCNRIDKYSFPTSRMLSYKESFMLEFMHENKLKVYFVIIKSVLYFV